MLSSNKANKLLVKNLLPPILIVKTDGLSQEIFKEDYSHHVEDILFSVVSMLLVKRLKQLNNTLTYPLTTMLSSLLLLGSLILGMLLKN